RKYWSTAVSSLVSWVSRCSTLMSRHQGEMASTLHAAHGEARRHATAERIVGGYRWQSIYDRSGHHVVPGRLVAVCELGERDGNRHAALVRQQQELVQIFVPCKEECIRADRDERGRHQ